MLPSDPIVEAKLEAALKGNAVLGIAQACQNLAPEEKLDLVATGSLTNIALFSKVFPQLLLDKVERIVLMGGAEGRGNKSAVAESNILCDAHAASIVLDLAVPVVMCVSARQFILSLLLETRASLCDSTKTFLWDSSLSTSLTPLSSLPTFIVNFFEVLRAYLQHHQ